VQAIQRMNIRPGDQVLEVGVGTGINLSLYPRACAVTGIDFSASMLEKARERISRKGVVNARLLQMDAQDLKFPDDAFDIVYAPYLISVVPDPVKVAREMRRVCRPGGRIVFLNHFLSRNPVLSRAERLISPFTVHIGFKADLDLPAFLAQAGLEPVSIEKVNVPRIWSLVTCVKE
jgi:phosphatidylethanolamine/phosphatidyl-N-methylethanolamine N-methyltransferase